MAKQSNPGRGSNSPPAVSPPDVATLDALVTAMYESVSFPPGSQPDFERLRALFHPEGRIIPPRTERGAELEVIDVENFIARSRVDVVTSGLERRGFQEREVARRSGVFGSMVHIFSTYESRYTANDPAPFQRGINSIQLVEDSNRFWILSILWEAERSGNPIPKSFLI